MKVYTLYKVGAAIYRIPNNGDVMQYWDSVYRLWMPAVINTTWSVRVKGKLLVRNVVFKDKACSQ
ncbi:hypothetical protein RCIP0104_00014 [Klebsiella phage RCIP0104]|jgi:hypothetical protein